MSWKSESQLKEDIAKQKNLKVFRARAKINQEIFLNHVADNAEGGIQKNNLREVYCAISDV